jgi:hypothetical protein
MNNRSNYPVNGEKNQLASPVFIVGAPRSGTTLMAVLLDRHSKIAIGPETQFFTEFIPQNWTGKTPETHEQLVDSALAFKRIADFNFDREQLLNHFRNYELTLPNLLRSIIEVHAIRTSKWRPGEKSPHHLQHIPIILHHFPDAKVICVLRDGRDVVRSLLDTPWAIPNNPRRLRLFCIRWNDAAEQTLYYQKTLSPDRFMTVKFEDILRQPRSKLEQICAFLGEEFELTQLEPAQPSNVIPGWEKQWKSKASEMLDPGRIEAWRKSADQKQIWVMNSMMGNMLERMGYVDTKLEGCPPLTRAKLFIQKVPYLPRMRRISAASLKALKRLKVAK